MILVSLPYFDTPWLARRAVDSILNQTHRDLVLVVTNDGGAHPWNELASITDPRLIRFDITPNRGRYYCDAVALAASPYPFFTVHDSDDWSESTRLQRLVEEIGEADLACDGFTRHGLNGKVDQVKPQPALAGHRGQRSLAHIGHHRGLWRTESLRFIGMNPAVRVGWDTYLMQLAAMTLDIRWVDYYGYHQQRRLDSLSQGPVTGINSKLRTEAITAMETIWSAARSDPDRITEICAPNPELAAELEADAARLRELL